MMEYKMKMGNINVMDMEVKQGSFIKEYGTQKMVRITVPSGFTNKKIKSILIYFKTYKRIIQLVNKSKSSRNWNIKPYNNKESLKVLDNELLDILNTKYLPSYISTELNGHRDNTNYTSYIWIFN